MLWVFCVSLLSLGMSPLVQQVEALAGLRGLALRNAAKSIVSAVDSQGRSALHLATIAGNLPLTEILIEINPSLLRSVDSEQLIPLRHAERIASKQRSIPHMRIASLLLEKTRGVNKGDEMGWQPIVWSIMARDIPRIKELLANGADVFSGRYGGHGGGFALAGRHNAVWAAEFIEDDEIIKILAEHAPDRYLPRAVGLGYRKFYRAMIERGADINVREGGYSATMRAAKAGREDDLRLLMANGGKIDGSVLLQAIHSGNPNLVEMILDHNVALIDDMIMGIVTGKALLTTDIDDTLSGNVADRGRKKIHRLLNVAWTEDLPPLVTISKLVRLKLNFIRLSH